MKSQSNPSILWTNVILFITTFLVATIGTTLYGIYQGYSAAHWVWLIICFSFCGLSITAGYHRLWSHKSYQAHVSLRMIFAIGGAFALQNSALHWSADHRRHHKYVDDIDRDPYSAKRGFWFSHIGWMLRDYQAETYSDYRHCRDLQRDPIVMWQHNYYVILAILTNIGIPVVLGLVYGDILGFLLIVGALRLLLSHHTTFFINSLAHVWGSQPYTGKNSARDNPILALVTFGEGYHNYHHLFENDYRNGIRWWQFDPTKWLIKLAECFKLANNLRTVSNYKIEKAKLTQQLQRAKDRIIALQNREKILATFEAELQQLLDKLQEYETLKQSMLTSAHTSVKEKYEHALVKVRMQQLELYLTEKKQQWKKLLNNPRLATVS